MHNLNPFSAGDHQNSHLLLKIPMLRLLAITLQNLRQKLHSLKSLLNYLSNGTKTKSFSQSSVVLQHFEFEKNALRISDFFTNFENSVTLKGLKK